MTSLLLALATLTSGSDDCHNVARPAANNWKSVTEKICSPDAYTSFGRLPRVCVVKPCECNEDRAAAPTNVWVKEFHEAARINFPRFALDGTPLEGEELLIYEGMRVTVDPDTGYYDVSFTATAPNMPVTLRLQLVFEKRGDHGVLDPATKSYRLTLPPIRLEPRKDAKVGDPSAYTFHINHRGYSSLFVGSMSCPVPAPQPVTASPAATTPPRTASTTPPNPCTTRETIDCKWCVRRLGVARFGTAVTQDEPGR